jgi:hypothetical protein
MLAQLVIKDGVPKVMQEPLKKLHDQINEYLRGLDPTEMIPAAQEAGYAMRYLQGAMAHVNSMSDTLKAMVTANGSVVLELNQARQDLTGLNEKVTKGLLVPKEDLDNAVKKAGEEARKALLPDIIASRKSVLETCGLPTPGDDILNLGATEYTPRFEQAKKNLGELSKKGIKPGGKGAQWIAKCAWNTQEEFNGNFELLKDVDFTAPGAGAAAGAAAAANNPDPVRGAGSAGADATPRKRMLA